MFDENTLAQTGECQRFDTTNMFGNSSVTFMDQQVLKVMVRRTKRQLDPHELSLRPRLPISV